MTPRLWKLSRVLESSADTLHSSYSRAATRFWVLWSEAATSTILSEWRRSRHLMAVAAALGAIGGIYVRGLFFDYNVVWMSTFVKSAEAVAGLVDFVLAPAFLIAHLLGIAPDTQLIVSPDGAPAGPVDTSLRARGRIARGRTSYDPRRLGASPRTAQKP